LNPPRVAARLALVLCGIAAFSTGLALVLQTRGLSTDLRDAARGRLDRSASSADQLIDEHLATLLDRYRAISATPEFRANLEVNHVPTLLYHAKWLVEQQGASLLLFASDENLEIAAAGDEALAPAALAALEASDPAQELVALSSRDGRPFALVALPLRTGKTLLGRLVAMEPLADETIALWSRLCGADLAFVASFGAKEQGQAEGLSKVLRELGELDLRVEVSLAHEQRALANARQKLLTAGALALALAFAASLVVARSFVRPIRAIQNASVAIGRGDLGVRLEAMGRDEIGDVSRAFNHMLDQLQATHDELEESKRGLANSQRLAHLGSWSFDTATDEISGSEEFDRVYEFGAMEAPMVRSDLLGRVHRDDRGRFASALSRCVAEGTPFRLDHRSVELDGVERFLHSQGKLVTSEDGQMRVEGTVQDITERKLVEEQVRYLANHDNLTGLGNRRLFKEHLDLAIEAARLDRSALGVLFLDLDNFKLINDTMGHSIGDQVLREVADRMAQTVRGFRLPRSTFQEAPTVTVSRLGGDEFTVLLTGIQGPEVAGRIARRVLRSLERPFDLEGQEVVISASIGIASWPADGDDVETLLRNCDTAMYHAKEQGRNNYQFYSESMNAVVFKRLVLENKLRKAIERDELELSFQPKLSLESGRVVGLEALARWRDPELGMISPSEFIPIAEETGLINAIGEWALEAAVRQVQKWEAEEQDLSELRISVNLSGHELHDDSVVSRVIGILGSSGVDPRRFDFEITETALMSNEEIGRHVLKKLRSLGVTISLDDFGTGYSSLSYLRDLPIDTLKIDRSFVQRIDEDSDDAALIGAIISMVKILRLKVVVEGVESEAQLSLLRKLGCDEVQGHLLSPPVGARDVAAMVRAIESEWGVEKDENGENDESEPLGR